MKMIKYIIVLWFSMVLLLGCSESLEETYDKWSGDGKIRYPAKCMNARVIPGWERLTVKWKNGTDAATKNVKVTWSANDMRDSLLLPPTDTVCEISGLKNTSYRIDIQTITEDGLQSLMETRYGRPYSLEHEIVRTFSQGITKYFRIGSNALIYFVGHKDEEHVLEMKLHYTNTAGNKVTQDVWPDDATANVNSCYIVKDIRMNEGDSVYISRVGLLPNCEDIIHFEPVVLKVNERVFTSDFKTNIQRHYGFTDQTDVEKIEFEHFIDTVRTLEFDFDIASLEDILYCPKLEKIVLGKNRYYWENQGQVMKGETTLYEVERSVNVLKMVRELNKNFTIERYNEHFPQLPKELAYMTISKENQQESDLGLNYLDVALIDKYECSEKDPQGYNSHLDWLFDNMPTTKWQTYTQADLRTYEITLYLKEAQLIKGIVVRQSRNTDKNSTSYYPDQIKIEVSENLFAWENVNGENGIEETLLGRAPGETNIVYLKKPGKYQYVRITMTDKTYITNSSLALADIVLFQ